jgi:glutamate 5-kinase
MKETERRIAKTRECLQILRPERVSLAPITEDKLTNGSGSIANAELIVMKFGTNSITKDAWICRKRIRKIARVVAGLMEQGKEIVIITSGAVAVGLEKNNTRERPKAQSDLQDLAAEGQHALMGIYEDAFRQYGIGVWQILLTHHNFQDNHEIREVVKRLNNSFGKGKVSILNTNDPVTKEELLPTGPHAFSDNDPLAALVAKCMHADALVIFSDSGTQGKGGGESKQRAIDLARESGVKVVVISIENINSIFEK